jgi:hypothetical protein
MGYVAYMEDTAMQMKSSSEKLKGREHLEDLGIDGRIILLFCLLY